MKNKSKNATNTFVERELMAYRKLTIDASRKMESGEWTLNDAHKAVGLKPHIDKDSDTLYIKA